MGSSNCGKTFVIKLLTKIYVCLQTSDTFNWVGTEKEEYVFISDFCWNEKVIPWSDVLNILEGENTHIPVPNTNFFFNAVWTADAHLLY